MGYTELLVMPDEQSPEILGKIISKSKLGTNGSWTDWQKEPGITLLAFSTSNSTRKPTSAYMLKSSNLACCRQLLLYQFRIFTLHRNYKG